MSAPTQLKTGRKTIFALIVSFLVPIFIMLLVFYNKEVYPFGDQSFLRTDLYHQYAPFFQEFREKLTEGDSLLYTWDIGGGTNFTALYSYYLASPFNFLVVLVSRSHVIEFITYLVVFKIGLSGLAFSWYLTKHSDKERFSVCFFGISYALSGYMAAYSWNIMWLDCLFLIPVILYGLELLVHEKKCFLYCISLGFSIFSNYYISIMICLFLVLYFIVLITTRESLTADALFGQISRFVLYSLLAGGLAAVIIVPTLYALSVTASAESVFPTTFTSYFSIIEVLARHLDAVEVEEGLDHWPNIFCGVAVLMLVPFYYMNRHVSYKEKIGCSVLIFIMIASFSINVLNFIWHGFHYPNSLPCRQSFLYIFVILVMAYKGFENIPERSSRQILGVILAAFFFIILVQTVCEDDAITWEVIWSSLIFTGIYALLIYQYQRGKSSLTILAVFTFVTLTAENFYNTNATSVTTVHRASYLDMDEAEKSLEEIAEERDSTGFYRMEKVSHRSKNDGAWLTYPSASTFSSMSYAANQDFYTSFGMESSMNAYSTTGATPFMYSFLDVKYLLSNEVLPESALYTRVADESYTTGIAESEQTLILYENNYTLPLGFVVKGLVANYETDAFSPFDEQDSFIREATDVETLFEILEPEQTGYQTSFYVETGGNIYLYSTNQTTELTVTHGQYVRTFTNVDRGYLLDLGYCEAGETIVATSSGSDSVSVIAGRFLDDAFIAAYEELAEEPMEIISCTSSSVTASVTTDGGLLLTTIPYDAGWTLTVDGIEVTPQAFADTYISFSIGAGTHSIELHYMPQGLISGCMLSIITIAIVLILYMISEEKEEKRRLAKKQEKEKKELPKDNETFDETLLNGGSTG